MVGKGVGFVDMNSPSPRHILVAIAIAVVMEAGSLLPDALDMLKAVIVRRICCALVN